MGKIDALRDEPLPKLVEALRPYKPKVLINYSSSRFDEAARGIGADMVEKGFEVKMIGEKMSEFEGYSGDEVESALRRDYDFVIDIRDGDTGSENEDVTQRIRRKAIYIQEEMPEKKYFRIQMAPDQETVKHVRRRAFDETRIFSWTNDEDKKQVVLAMLNTFEGTSPRVSPWEAQFAERAYLLELPCAVFSLEDFLPPERRHLIKELLGEYDTLILVDNKNGAAETLPFDLASETFDLHHRDGVTTLDCGGCGDPRGAIPLAPTEHGNGVLVVESCTCENCGRYYSALFTKDNLLKDVLAKRNK